MRFCSLESPAGPHVPWLRWDSRVDTVTGGQPRIKSQHCYSVTHREINKLKKKKGWINARKRTLWGWLLKGSNEKQITRQQLVPGEQSSERDTEEGDFSLQEQRVSFWTIRNSLRRENRAEKKLWLNQEQSREETLSYLPLVQLNKVKSRWEVSLHNSNEFMPVLDNHSLTELW